MLIMVSKVDSRPPNKSNVLLVKGKSKKGEKKKWQ